jgi:hypothetical protein
MTTMPLVAAATVCYVSYINLVIYVHSHYWKV